MQLTSKHPASSLGVPVFVDAEGNPMTYAGGIKMTRNLLGLTQDKLAHMLGVSVRTVESWEVGARMPGIQALAAMRPIVKRANRLNA